MGEEKQPFGVRLDAARPPFADIATHATGAELEYALDVLGALTMAAYVPEN